MQLPKTSQGLFYFKVADPPLMSAIFRAYNDWLAEFCRTDPARLKGIAMINLDDVQDGIKELERAARLGLAGAMITEYPLEHRRYGSRTPDFRAGVHAMEVARSAETGIGRKARLGYRERR
jgi:predicted TIM-barrel fold metal-dependent hydrolase